MAPQELIPSSPDATAHGVMFGKSSSPEYASAQAARSVPDRDWELERLESEAREAQRGLWADPYPVPPWEWGKRK